MTLFELNQANYANAPTMTKESLTKSIPYVATFISKYKSNYYLLLEKEQRYYTLFTFKQSFNPTKLAKELIDVASHLGEVKSIEESESGNGMLEIWVVDKITGECRMYGFFDYQGGTIEI